MGSFIHDSNNENNNSSEHNIPNSSDDDDLTKTVHLGRERQRRAKQCSSLKFFIYKQQLLIWSFWIVAIFNDWIQVEAFISAGFEPASVTYNSELLPKYNIWTI